MAQVCGMAKEHTAKFLIHTANQAIAGIFENSAICLKLIALAATKFAVCAVCTAVCQF
jgi:hypothetical protein